MILAAGHRGCAREHSFSAPVSLTSSLSVCLAVCGGHVCASLVGRRCLPLLHLVLWFFSVLFVFFAHDVGFVEVGYGPGIATGKPEEHGEVTRDYGLKCQLNVWEGTGKFWTFSEFDVFRSFLRTCGDCPFSTEDFRGRTLRLRRSRLSRFLRACFRRCFGVRVGRKFSVDNFLASNSRISRFGISKSPEGRFRVNRVELHQFDSDFAGPLLRFGGRFPSSRFSNSRYAISSPRDCLILTEGVKIWTSRVAAAVPFGRATSSPAEPFGSKEFMKGVFTLVSAIFGLWNLLTFFNLPFTFGQN